MMGFIFSVNMSYSEKMFTLTELSYITVDPSELNPTFSEDSTLEDSMWNIISFGIVKNTKSLFLVWPLGDLFLALQLGLLELELSLLVLHFFLSNSFLAPLAI